MKLENWLIEQGLAPEAHDAEELLERFLNEMDAGLGHDASSLPMIPSHIAPPDALPANEPVAVIDAGGTNLRTCVVEFDQEGSPRVSNFHKQPMPGSRAPTTAADFFRTLADAMEPYLDRVERIGFCFSYTTEITPELDGVLLHWTKEIQMPDLVGERVGLGLREELERRGHAGKKIAVLNDTVATLLAGMSEAPASAAPAGFILGTGMNSAYVESNARIAKQAESDPAKHQIINVESGNYAAFDRGPIDRAFDAASENPEHGLFEKATSGAYLGELALLTLKHAGEAGLLSAEAAAFFDELDALHIMHPDNFATENGRDIGPFEGAPLTADDARAVRTVFRALVARSALFSAVNLAALAIHGENDFASVNVDGSTFHKTDGLPEAARATLKALLEPRGIRHALVHVDDAPIIGGAAAAFAAV